MGYRLTAALVGAAFVLTMQVSRADAQGSKRPRTVKALVHHIVASLKSGNVNKYLLLAPTHAEMARYCPKMKVPPKMVAKLHKKLRRGFDRCRKQINWRSARLVSFRGGQKKKRPVRECNGVWELKDIELELNVRGKIVHVKIDDPFVLNGVSFGVTDDPRCGARAATPPTKTVPYHPMP